MVTLIRPMLATLGPLPTGKGWATEFKWDGVRVVAYVGEAGVTAMSRNDLDVTHQYPEVTELSLGGRTAVLDGEIVALDRNGVPDFARLQTRMHVKAPSAALVSGTPVTYYLFDIMALDGESVVTKPYTARRDLLEQLQLDSGVTRTPPAFLDGDPAAVYDAAVEQGLEGIVCKRSHSAYHPGRRSPDWVKVPIARTQEVIVIGWQPGAGRRAGLIGALLLAAYNHTNDLVYVGKVGTGFTDAMLKQMAADLAPLQQPDNPAVDVPKPDARVAHWVRPELVGEVAFRTWTPDARLRHPSWRGLRPDKEPHEVRVS
jgi:bifunctional non-homologous end joining protein LigD